jgi:hypothetical protein
METTNRGSYSTWAIACKNRQVDRQSYHRGAPRADPRLETWCARGPRTLHQVEIQPQYFIAGLAGAFCRRQSAASSECRSAPFRFNPEGSSQVGEKIP